MKKETKEKKKPTMTQKAKKIRSIVMMSLLCVLLLSAATYAWFTLSNTAKISNLTMTVGDVTGLQVADIADTDTANGPADESSWKAETTAVEFNGKLLPATTTDGIDIYEPVYDESGSVSDLSASATTKKLDSNSVINSIGYYVEYSFWIRALGPTGAQTTVKLAPGEGLNDGIYNASASGTYSLSSSKNDGILPSAAVRVSLINNTAVKVYEPNADFSAQAQKVATDSRTDKTAKSSDVKQKVDGTYDSSVDTTVLTLENNKATKITLKIWLEGTDAQCGNEIAANKIITQLKFVTAE